MKKENLEKERIALAIQRSVSHLNSLIKVASQVGLNTEIKGYSSAGNECTPLLSISIYELKEYPTVHHTKKKCKYHNHTNQRNKPTPQKFGHTDRWFPRDLHVFEINERKECGCTLCSYHPDNLAALKKKRQLEDDWRDAISRS